MDPSEILRRFGGNVRRCREQRGWTQQRLADEAGLDRSYVSGVERGVRNPTVVTLVVLAKALDADVASLISGRSEDPS